MAQFTDEATLASSLVHANIVPIFDFAKVGIEYLLVEEYIVGRDLGRLVRARPPLGKPLAATVVAHIGVEALKALDYAHSKRDHDGLPLGIVHRDVSPENIMVTMRGEVQLLDFGVMKVDDRRRAHRLGRAARATWRSWRPSRPAAWRSTPAPICSRWAWCSISP